MIDSMKRCLYKFSVLLLIGCGNDMAGLKPVPAESDMAMKFGVSSGATTRSLVGDKNSEGEMEAGMMTLNDLCTPSVGDRAISVWGDYRSNSAYGRDDYINIFKETALTYNPRLGADSHRWVYDDPARYWIQGCSYRFRAYFPSLIEPISSSNVSTLSLEYPSNRIQEDLLVAYNEVDTGDAGFDGQTPVELYFRHTLAALKFRFELDYANTDTITAVWFENGVKNDFAVGGILFCERRESGGRIFSSTAPPKESELDAYFQWLEGYHPEPGVDQFYKWTCTQSDGVANGLRLETTLDESNNLRVVTSACAYDCTSEMTATGETFTRNGGWLLVIPQESSGNLRLCFQTEHGGSSTVFRVAIPKYTGPMVDDEGRYVDADGNVVASASQAAQYDRWRAGKRYTYTIKIRKSNLQVSLAVADWNMRYSSTQIEF